jgi:hypothetical protein
MGSSFALFSLKTRTVICFLERPEILLPGHSVGPRFSAAEADEEPGLPVPFLNMGVVDWPFGCA